MSATPNRKVDPNGISGESEYAPALVVPTRPDQSVLAGDFYPTHGGRRGNSVDPAHINKTVKANGRPTRANPVGAPSVLGY